MHHGIKHLKSQSQDAHSLVISYMDSDGVGVALVQRKSQGFITSDSAFVHFDPIRDTNHFVEPTSPTDSCYYEVACHLSGINAIGLLLRLWFQHRQVAGVYMSAGRTEALLPIITTLQVPHCNLLTGFDVSCSLHVKASTGLDSTTCTKR